MLQFSPGGGRIDSQSSQPFTIHYKNGQPAAVSPADVKATVEGPSRVVHQLRGAGVLRRIFINRRSQQIQCIPENLCSWTVPNYSYGEKQVCGIRLVSHLRQHVIDSPVFSPTETDPQKCQILGQKNAQVGNYKVTLQLVDTEGNPLSMSLGK